MNNSINCISRNVPDCSDAVIYLSFFFLYSRDGLGGDFVTVVGEALDHVVVAVLVRDEESSLERTVVGVHSVGVEYLLIVVKVVVVHGSVERQQDHLWCLKLLCA